ncbi:cellulose biosynthesis cyclic di-GMP-binding regulatory protein BcsB [Methylomonas sp. MgM2]
MHNSAFVLVVSFALLLTVVLTAAAETTTHSIDQYMSNDEAIMLRHADGEYSISIPVSDRVKPNSATLNLALSNSNVLNGKRSQLAIYVNDYIVGQIRLDPINNNTLAKIQIDPEYLKRGYNKISFKAAQHYTDSECEDWSAPELWTQIDAVKSTFTLDFEPAAITEKLSSIDALINDRLGRYPLTILRGDALVSDRYLYWGAIISQAVKLRLKYVPLQLDETSVTPSGDNAEHFAIPESALKNDAVLVGTKSQIADLVPLMVADAIEGPYLGIFRQDHDETRFILVVSGNNEEQVSVAAQALALLNAPFPDRQQTVLNTPSIPTDPTLLAPRSIVPGQSYRFAQLDYRNTLAKSREAALELNLPANFYSTEDSMVTLNLNLAYGAAMRGDSVINIELNDTFVHAIILKEPDGAHYRNYRIGIPLRSFRAGLNTLTFNAELTPLESGECTYIQRKNLVATLYEDSTISFPDAGRVAELPDLKLFTSTGFPLAQNASAKGTVFKLLDTSSDSIAAAWQLIATIADQQRIPLFDINITQGDVPATDNLAIIGKTGGAERMREILDYAPVKLGKINQFPYAFKQRQSVSEPAVWQRLRDAIFDNPSTTRTVEIDEADIALAQTAGIGDEFLLMSYPNPTGNGVVLALLSDDANHLSRGVSQLTSPSLWSQVQGNVFVWQDQQRFHWQRHGETITLGEDNLRLTMVMHFSNHPWQWLMIVFLLLIVTAWVVHKLLNQYQRSKH